MVLFDSEFIVGSDISEGERETESVQLLGEFCAVTQTSYIDLESYWRCNTDELR